ncbi:stress transcription factor A [Seminavis robusta]|uniref:Stress transcription factor A n=1 Tax=Seminavis robusta TaxID=568900 RepID=A0A9N8F1Y4_9STRA|nr:stress transcription factor A [Seminavis robusta]|eukprot:Sro3261_g345960.1 stress transcription factor A (833) ;mRNA; f:3807-6697
MDPNNSSNTNTTNNAASSNAASSAVDLSSSGFAQAFLQALGIQNADNGASLLAAAAAPSNNNHFNNNQYNSLTLQPQQPHPPHQQQAPAPPPPPAASLPSNNSWNNAPVSTSSGTQSAVLPAALPGMPSTAGLKTTGLPPASLGMPPNTNTNSTSNANGVPVQGNHNHNDTTLATLLELQKTFIPQELQTLLDARQRGNLNNVTVPVAATATNPAPPNAASLPPPAASMTTENTSFFTTESLIAASFDAQTLDDQVAVSMLLKEIKQALKVCLQRIATVVNNNDERVQVIDELQRLSDREKHLEQVLALKTQPQNLTLQQLLGQKMPSTNTATDADRNAAAARLERILKVNPAASAAIMQQIGGTNTVAAATPSINPPTANGALAELQRLLQQQPQTHNAAAAADNLKRPPPPAPVAALPSAAATSASGLPSTSATSPPVASLNPAPAPAPSNNHAGNAGSVADPIAQLQMLMQLQLQQASQSQQTPAGIFANQLQQQNAVAAQPQLHQQQHQQQLASIPNGNALSNFNVAALAELLQRPQQQNLPQQQQQQPQQLNPVQNHQQNISQETLMALLALQQPAPQQQPALPPPAPPQQPQLLGLAAAGAASAPAANAVASNQEAVQLLTGLQQATLQGNPPPAVAGAAPAGAGTSSVEQEAYLLTRLQARAQPHAPAQLHNAHPQEAAVEYDDDYDDDEDEEDDEEGASSAPKKRRRGRTGTFPQKMHNMLEDLEKNGESHIASFLPHGKAFAIHRNKDFVKFVMPKYFNMGSFASFQRQLNLYNFKRINEGPDRGAYRHREFIRGQPLRSTNMRRTKIKGAAARRRGRRSNCS